MSRPPGGPGAAGGGVAPDDDEQPQETEPVTGTSRTVREVEALPDGRRITWYAQAEDAG